VTEVGRPERQGVVWDSEVRPKLFQIERGCRQYQDEEGAKAILEKHLCSRRNGKHKVCDVYTVEFEREIFIIVTR
jgi:hypothetical protein